VSGTTDLAKEPVARLKEGQGKFFGHLIKQNERAEFWRTLFNFALVSTGGVVAGMGKLSGVAEPHATWMTGVGLVMVAVGTIFVGIFDFRRSKLTTQAKEALGTAAEFLDEKNALETKLANVET